MSHLQRQLFALIIVVAATDACAHGGSSQSVRLGKDSLAIRFTGMAEGSHTLELSPSENGYLYTERVSLLPLFQRSMRIELGPAMEVRRVTSDGLQFGHATSSDIRYDDGRAVGKAVRAGEKGPETVTIDTLLPAGAFDGSALFPRLLSQVWTVGQSEELVLFDLDEGNITTQTIRVVAEERLQVPAGTFDALRLELSTTQLPVTLWISKATPDRLLKLGFANGDTVLIR